MKSSAGGAVASLLGEAGASNVGLCCVCAVCVNNLQAAGR